MAPPHLTANPEAAMHQDFSKHSPANEDGRSLREWKNRSGILYGLALPLLVGFAAIQNMATGMPHKSTASAANTVAGIEKSRLP